MTDLQAGPELDAEIARRVFGIDVLGMAPCHHEPDGCGLAVGTWDGQDVLRPVYLEQWPDPCQCRRGEYFGHASYCLSPVWGYSTDIAAAWLVVEKMRERFTCKMHDKFNVEVHYHESEDDPLIRVFVDFDTCELPRACAFGATASETICRAVIDGLNALDPATR